MHIESIKFMLMAHDMDRAVAFYRDVMGLEVRSRSPMWSELAHGDAVVALHGGGQGEFNETGLSFQVSDIESACAEVESGGGRIRKAPENRPGEPIKLAELSDSEGNGFTMAQYVG
ncbi:MAG: VOC family protein [Chloroflexi bacterium]|nr:VOC family protein [Chloroflexota bacterium]